jgi:predicted  nucleic acid-binding Zn-ribbon protein
MNLGELVSELEQDYENLKQECRQIEERCDDMEQQLDDVEQDLETTIQQRNKLQEFYTWVELAYPVVVKDYQSVKIIEEIANGI